MKLHVEFSETEENFQPNFGEVYQINNFKPPPEYGLITYDQNKIITVS